MINNDGLVIGGHKLSGLSLAVALQKNNWRVGLLMAPLRMDIPDMDIASLTFHPAPLSHNIIFSIIRRCRDILKVIYSGQ